MVVFNYSGGEINTKIVYYGPGLSGKTTNLEYIYSKMPVQIKGKMISMKTRTDRTLFFDFLPLDLGDISGFKLRFLLYTVPGQVYYNATRKLVLKGADAVIFVADSGRDKLSENIESLKNLETNLNEHDLSLDTIPWVIQYNKRDLADALPVAELEKALNVLNVPSFEAVATNGTGVYETFQKVSSMLYYQVKHKLDQEEKESEDSQVLDEPAVQSPQPAAPPPDLGDVIDTALREVPGPDAPVTVAARGGAEPAGPDSGERTAPRDTHGDGEDDMQRDDDNVTYDPPGIASRAGSNATSDLDEFKFASLQDMKINGDVGRVVDLEEDEALSSDASHNGEFVTDPCRPVQQDPPESRSGGEQVKPSAVETLAERPPAVDTVIKVPVRVPVSRTRTGAPVKIVLEIKFDDDQSV